MDFIKVLIVNMKLKHLHLRTRIKQRLFKQYGLRLLKVRKQEFYGKKFELVGMHIRSDYETGWLIQLAQDAEVIFDVGCNTGQTAVLFHAFSQASKIYLFEPNPYALAICAENAILNGFAEKIKLYNNCVSNISGKEMEFYTVLSGAAGSVDQDFARTASNLGESYLTNSITLDGIVKCENVVPDLVKIDVEGHEYQVLCGSMDLAQRKKTKFLVEMHSSPSLTMEENGFNVINWAKEHNYKVIYLKEMVILRESSQIKHRGRCHLLLAPSEYILSPVLQSIKQGVFPERIQ